VPQGRASPSPWREPHALLQPRTTPKAAAGTHRARAHRQVAPADRRWPGAHDSPFGITAQAGGNLCSDQARTALTPIGGDRRRLPLAIDLYGSSRRRNSTNNLPSHTCIQIPALLQRAIWKPWTTELPLRRSLRSLRVGLRIDVRDAIARCAQDGRHRTAVPWMERNEQVWTPCRRASGARRVGPGASRSRCRGRSDGQSRRRDSSSGCRR
jgi:hypothetical protein